MSRRRSKEQPAEQAGREIHLVAEPRPKSGDETLIPVFEELPVFEEVDVPLTATDPVAKMVLNADPAGGEQFRLLGARLKTLRRERRIRRLGVVSAAQGEGKTTIALGLARSLAVDGQQRVLLIELDLRRPAIDRRLGLEAPEVGLRQYLEGDAGATISLRRPEGAGFWILSAGEGALTRPEALTSQPMMALLTSAERVFDYTVIDCPPLLPVADTVVFQDQVDGFVFVVRSRHNSRKAVQQAVDLVKRDRILGMIMNDHRDILPSYRKNAYRGYTSLSHD